MQITKNIVHSMYFHIDHLKIMCITYLTTNISCKNQTIK